MFAQKRKRTNRRGMSFLGDIICSTRTLLVQGFRSLPVLLAGAILTLGLTQANYNLLFFFVGLFLITPLATLLLNMIIEFSMGFWPFTYIDKTFWSAIANTEQCNLFSTPVFGAPVSNDPITVVPSYWMTVLAFFFSYLFYNAENLYKKPATKSAPKAEVNARKNQSMVSMIVIIISAVIFSILRYGTTCETIFGIVTSWLLGGSLAYGWYKFMRSCGFGRLDDLFGISNQMLPFETLEDQDPTVCVPTD